MPKKKNSFNLDVSVLQKSGNWKANLRRYIIETERAYESGVAEPYIRSLDPGNASYEKDLSSLARNIGYRLDGETNWGFKVLFNIELKDLDRIAEDLARLCKANNLWPNPKSLNPSPPIFAS